MTAKQYVIVDEIREVANKVSNALTPQLVALDPNITGVHYEHGHPMEIIKTLKEKDESKTFKFKRYPLIALFQDFPETHNIKGFQCETTLHLIIAKTTLPNYKAEKRYEKNFKPFLYPIYEKFKYELGRHKAFQVSGGEAPHTKIDRLFWGREGLLGNTANMFDDWIDCIEIKNLKLLVNLKNC